MKHVLLAFIVLMQSLLALVANAESPEHQTLRIVTEPWEPFMGPDLPDQGYLPALVRESFKRSGYTIRIEFMPWPRSVYMAKTGAADALLGAYFTEARTRYLAYSDPLGETKDVLFARQGQSIQFASLDDLKPYLIGVVRDAAHGKAFDEATFLQKEEVTGREQNVEKLMKGRIALMAGPLNVTQYLIRNRYPAYASQIVVLDPPINTNKIYLGFSKMKPDYNDLVRVFNEGLASMKKDGTFDLIIKKHGIE